MLNNTAKEILSGGLLMLSEQDMTDLICIYDAYNAINTALFGELMVFGLNEGNFGAFG